MKKKVTIYAAYSTYGNEIKVDKAEAIETSKQYRLVSSGGMGAFSWVKIIHKSSCKAFKTREEALKSFIRTKRQKRDSLNLEVGKLENEIKQAVELCLSREDLT